VAGHRDRGRHGQRPALSPFSDVDTEGPTWNGREGHFSWVDIIGDAIYRWVPGEGTRVIMHPSGKADGMTLDRQGNLYVAMHNGNPKNPNTGIVVLRPDGQLLERIPTPGVGWTTNLGFGRGADANSLYVTTAIPIRLFRIQTVRRGHYF